MYVCLCNGVSDRDFRLHVEGEDRTVSGVYHSLGVKPKCGKCVPFVRQLMRQAAEIRQPHSTRATAR
jgi:bacterioferritin-associated ferredoxin